MSYGSMRRDTCLPIPRSYPQVNWRMWCQLRWISHPRRDWGWILRRISRILYMGGVTTLVGSLIIGNRGGCRKWLCLIRSVRVGDSQFFPRNLECRSIPHGWLKGSPESISGGEYDKGSGVAIECQGFPDAPNRPSFPSQLLRPGERYCQQIFFSFSTRELRK